MKNIRKNRFLLWLMWIIPISLCGMHFAIIWTVVQILLYGGDKNDYKKSKVPIWEDPEIIKMNKDIKLDKDYEGAVKIDKGVYIYQRKR